MTLKAANPQSRNVVVVLLGKSKEGLSPSELENLSRIRRNTLFEILADLKTRGALIERIEKRESRKQGFSKRSYTIYSLNPYWVRLRNSRIEENLRRLKEQLGHKNCKSCERFHPGTDLVRNRKNYHWKHSDHTAHDSRLLYLWFQCVYDADSTQMSPVNPMFPLGELGTTLPETSLSAV